MYAKLCICIPFSQVPCHWPSWLFVSKFKIKRLYLLSHLFTRISPSLLESMRRMKNVKSLPLSLVISFLTLQRPACKYIYKPVTHACPGKFFFCCFTVVLVMERGFTSPGKMLKPHLFSRVPGSAQLLQRKPGRRKGSAVTGVGTHCSPTAGPSDG